MFTYKLGLGGIVHVDYNAVNSIATITAMDEPYTLRIIFLYYYSPRTISL